MQTMQLHTQNQNQNSLNDPSNYFFAGAFAGALGAAAGGLGFAPVAPCVDGAVLPPRPAPVFAAVLAPRPAVVPAFVPPRAPVTPLAAGEAAGFAVGVVAALDAPRAVPPPRATALPPRDAPVAPAGLGFAAAASFLLAPIGTPGAALIALMAFLLAPIGIPPESELDFGLLLYAGPLSIPNCRLMFLSRSRPRGLVDVPDLEPTAPVASLMKFPVSVA